MKRRKRRTGNNRKECLNDSQKKKNKKKSDTSCEKDKVDMQQIFKGKRKQNVQCKVELTQGIALHTHRQTPWRQEKTTKKMITKSFNTFFFWRHCRPFFICADRSAAAAVKCRSRWSWSVQSLQCGPVCLWTETKRLCMSDRSFLCSVKEEIKRTPNSPFQMAHRCERKGPARSHRLHREKKVTSCECHRRCLSWWVTELVCETGKTLGAQKWCWVFPVRTTDLRPVRGRKISHTLGKRKKKEGERK